MTTFDPDELPPTYDDRPERVIKAPDPVVQKRNRGNRQRGRRTERLWAALINEALDRAGLVDFERAVSKGVAGGADVVWTIWAFECKHRHMGWPSNTTIKNALVQAAANADNRTPIVIACMTTHNRREWRFYNAVGMYMDAIDWLAERVEELKE